MIQKMKNTMPWTMYLAQNFIFQFYAIVIYPLSKFYLKTIAAIIWITVYYFYNQ